MTITRQSLYYLGGGLLLLTGVSHMSEIVFYEPTKMVKIASFFGLIYAALGVLILRQTAWAPWITLGICSFGLYMGTSRLLSGPLNIQFAGHQLIHLMIISICVALIVWRYKNAR